MQITVRTETYRGTEEGMSEPSVLANYSVSLCFTTCLLLYSIYTLHFYFRDTFKMGWQTTFTLAKRSKGCHLVTEEVLQHIKPGLEGVSVS